MRVTTGAGRSGPFDPAGRGDTEPPAEAFGAWAGPAPTTVCTTATMPLLTGSPWVAMTGRRRCEPVAAASVARAAPAACTARAAWACAAWACAACTSRGQAALQRVDLRLLGDGLIQRGQPGLGYPRSRGLTGSLLGGQGRPRRHHVGPGYPVLIDHVLEIASRQAGVGRPYRRVRGRRGRARPGARYAAIAAHVTNDRRMPQRRFRTGQPGLQMDELHPVGADLLGKGVGLHGRLLIGNRQLADPGCPGHYGCLQRADLVAGGADLVRAGVVAQSGPGRGTQDNGDSGADHRPHDETRATTRSGS